MHWYIPDQLVLHNYKRPIGHQKTLSKKFCPAATILYFGFSLTTLKRNIKEMIP